MSASLQTEPTQRPSSAGWPRPMAPVVMVLPTFVGPMKMVVAGEGWTSDAAAFSGKEA